MKITLAMISFVTFPVAALTVNQDQGQLKLRFAPLNRPYEMLVEVPEGCAKDSVTVEKSESQISIKHRPGCSTGATVYLQVNLGQGLSAVLGAGSLELNAFSSAAASLGRISVESKIGAVNVPLGAGFSKTFDNYVGRAYERAGHGPEVDLKVNTGLIQVAR